MLAAAGVAQAFPDYTLYPADGTEFNSAENLANFNLTFTGVNVEVADAAYALLESDQGDEAESTNFVNYMNSGTIIINFDSAEIVANGLWTLTIPAGSMTVNGEESPEITAMYTLNDPTLGLGEFPKIELLSVDPASGSKFPVFGGDFIQKIDFTTSDDAAVNYIDWTLYDVTDKDNKEYVVSGAESRYNFNRYQHDDDIWVDGLYIAVGGNSILVEGHEYSLDLTFCGIGIDRVTKSGPTPQEIAASIELQTSVTYYGLTPAPEYSKAEYLSVSPNPEDYEILTPAQAMFDITYSAPVKPCEFTYPLGSGMGTANAGTFEPYQDAEVDEKGYCTRWQFVVSESVVENITGVLTVNVQTKDVDGLYVKGNQGMLYDNYNYTITWDCNCGTPSLISVSPADQSMLESLSSITVSNEKNGRNYVMACYDGVSTPARILNMNREEILVLDRPVFDEDNLQATWSFAPITDDGTYILEIPKWYFNLGEEMEGSLSNQTEFRYYVVNNNTSNVTYDIEPMSVDPASGSNVESIGDVVLTFDDVTFYPMDGSAPKIQLYVMNGPDAQLIQEIDPYNGAELASNDWFSPTVYTIHFDEVTADGEYQVLIPEGVFCDETYDMNMGESGHANPEIVLSYTIGEVNPPSNVDFSIEPVRIAPENESTLEEISTVTVEFGQVVFPAQVVDGPAVNFVPGVLYKLTEEGEEELQSVDPFDNPASNWFNPTIYDFKFTKVTEIGQYKVVIEKGTFGNDPFLESGGTEGKANAEIVLYYAIGSVGVDAIVDGASVINVYDLNGVQVLKDASVEAAKELKSGLYIINGKKVMIRR